MTTTFSFPLSAVVGHDDVKLALLLNAVDARIGGVLLRGQKGSAKSTLARGLAALLGGGAPFVELPVGATEDRVVGSLDLQAALTGEGRRLQPGLLASADGGVLYVDEVNLLPDHLVDVLLDVAASGVNRIEREGVSASHPSRFVLVGSMNPEEGELRPQLLDRFGLAVDVVSSLDPAERAQAVIRRLRFDADPAGFTELWAAEEQSVRERLAAAGGAELPDELVSTATSLCAGVGAEGLRADLVICRAAAALAAWEGRREAGVDDVRRVAHLALAHRRRRSPFEEPGIDQQEIDEALDKAPPPPRDGDGDEAAEAGTPPATLPGEGKARNGDGDSGTPPAVPPGEPPAVRRLVAPRRVDTQPAGGRRSLAEGPRGRLVGDRTPTGALGSVAVGATVRTAVERRAGDPEDARLVAAGDLREAVREERVGNLLVLAVDASGSMGAERRMEAVKGAVLGLLLDAYQRRDRVALVTFRGEGAEVVLRPTGSVEVARARLHGLRTGGRTPLAAGIEEALQVATRQAPNGHRPLLVLLSDGRATFATEGDDPLGAALAAAATVRRTGVPSVVIDAESEGRGPRLGLATAIADAMGARMLQLDELSAGALVGALRKAASSS